MVASAGIGRVSARTRATTQYLEKEMSRKGGKIDGKMVKSENCEVNEDLVYSARFSVAAFPDDIDQGIQPVVRVRL